MRDILPLMHQEPFLVYIEAGPYLPEKLYRKTSLSLCEFTGYHIIIPEGVEIIVWENLYKSNFHTLSIGNNRCCAALHPTSTHPATTNHQS